LTAECTYQAIFHIIILQAIIYHYLCSTSHITNPEGRLTFMGQGRHTLRSISDPVYPAPKKLTLYYYEIDISSC